INQYGADTLRTFILSLGEYSENVIWSDRNIKGITRFLDKFYRLKDKVIKEDNYSSNLESLINKTIKIVSEHYDNMKFNTAISSIMILVNEYNKQDNITTKDLKVVINLLYPIAPHICAEMWEKIEDNENIVFSKWPEYDESKIKNDVKEIVIQINGKIRTKMNFDETMSEEHLNDKVLLEPSVQKFIMNKEVIKIIYVKNKLVNIVIK
ncbi:MAG: class I tRNA ligase family protein, partial [Bacilli bacterium]